MPSLALAPALPAMTALDAPSAAVPEPRRGRAAGPSRAEKRLAARLRKGDPRALETLHAELGPMVFGYLRQALGDRAEAEDVFQLVMTEVWRRGGEYDPHRASPATWVMTIARSRAIDHLRRRRPEPRDPATLPDVVPDGSDDDLHAERWRMAALLGLLSPDEREVLRLRFYEELSQTEIAERTGIALGTVKTRMVRALERLGEMVEADDARAARRIEEESR